MKQLCPDGLPGYLSEKEVIPQTSQEDKCESVD